MTVDALWRWRRREFEGAISRPKNLASSKCAGSRTITTVIRFETMATCENNDAFEARIVRNGSRGWGVDGTQDVTLVSTQAEVCLMAPQLRRFEIRTTTLLGTRPIRVMNPQIVEQHFTH